MTAPTSEESPKPRASAQTVGWALTALTLLVLVVGVVIIRQASSDWRRVDPEPYTPSASIPSPSKPITHGLSEANSQQAGGSAPLVLQPIQTDAEEDTQPWDSSKTARDTEEETTLR